MSGILINLMRNLRSELPKISVITVCYNSDKTILKTIQSYDSQDYPNKNI